MTVLRALIVDDDRDFAASLADLIRLHGHDAWAVFSGSDAFDRLRNQKFDIAFVDVRMPGLSGLDVIQELRDYDLKVRIIPMTAFTLRDVLLQAVGDGRVALLRGPAELSVIAEELQKIAPDGILLIADDSPDIVHRLRTGLAEHGFTVRRIETLERQEPTGSPEEDVGRLIVNLIDTGETVVDQLEDWMAHRNGGLKGRSIIIARRDLPADPSADPFSTPEVTGCIFKPFVPEDYIDRMIAERS